MEGEKSGMMRFALRIAIAVGLSFVLFYVMQVLFGRPHCFDCGVTYGFPFSYVQEGTYATHGHFLWPGFIGDFTIAFAISALAIVRFTRKKKISN
jgi:hypothetical protein